MKLLSLLLLTAGLGLGTTHLRAQADEHAIRTTTSISTIDFVPGQGYFYTITVRAWSDVICFPGQPSRTASQLASSAWQVVVHSTGNISLRFYKIGNAALNNGIVELWHNGVKVDADRLRML